MPKAWSKKDERQYKHILGDRPSFASLLRVAKRIAAATVNKQRGKEGRAKRTGK